MNCYLCLSTAEQIMRSACALCQSCGAAMCETHLVVYVHQPVVGMGTTRSRRNLICSQCFTGCLPQSQPTTHRKKSTFPQQHWWTRLWQPRQAVLPTAQEVITEVERFLKQQ